MAPKTAHPAKEDVYHKDLSKEIVFQEFQHKYAEEKQKIEDNLEHDIQNIEKQLEQLRTAKMSAKALMKRAKEEAEGIILLDTDTLWNTSEAKKKSGDPKS